MASEKYKVVLIGDPQVGKTSLFTRFKTGSFPDEPPQQTRKESECDKRWTHKGQELQITLYDTAGMERFSSTIPPTYFRKAKAVIFVYAINSQESIDNIPHWTESISPQRLGNEGGDMVQVLVGNKCDLPDDERIVTRKRGEDTADNCEIDRDLFFEVSAKSGESVDDMFLLVAKRLRAEGGGSVDAPMPPSSSRSCCSKS